MRTLLCAFLLTLTLSAPADYRPTELEVEVDVSGAKDLEEWANKSKTLVEDWHAKIAAMLPGEGFTPPMQVKLVFREMEGVAYTLGNQIHISAAWVRQQPGDFGMVVHELVHVIQQYPNNRDAGWLVEGIADYIRFFQYEPQVKVVVDPKRASYKDGYRTTGAFLNWVVHTHDKDLVSKLNGALRKGVYKEELFKEVTGKTVGELWEEYVKTLEAAAK